METAVLVMIEIFFIEIFISSVTAMSALYYYDESVHTKIEVSSHDMDTGSFLVGQIIYLAAFGIFSVVLMLYINKTAGTILSVAVLALGYVISDIVKKKMTKITRINLNLKFPANVVFNSKLSTAVLSPLSSSVVIAIFLIAFSGICVAYKIAG
jgi:hypothetical protein